MADTHDDRNIPEMPAVDLARLQGHTPQQPSGTGGGSKSGQDTASGNAETRDTTTDPVTRGGR